MGLVDDLAPSNGYLAVTTPDGTPVLVTTDAAGTMRAFLNVCRHRGAPLAEGCGTARALACPYHAWVYRLDGGLARHHGMEGAADFDPLDHSLHPASVATWGRFVFVSPQPDAPPFDLGPLAAALGPYDVGTFTEVVRESTERAFNWKVLVENYSENFHTPWVHPELIVRGWDYPIVNEGAVSLAWDRPLQPRNRTEEVLATVRPGDPGWHEVASDQIDDVFIAGVYFTVWPNLLVSVFPRYLSAFWLTPTGPTSTRVDYLRAWHPSVSARPPRRRPRGQPPGRGAGPRHLRGRAARVQRRHRHRRPAVAGARDRCRPRPRVAAAGHRRRWLTVTWHREPSWVGCAWCARRASRNGATRSWRPPASW